jgi:hypothetical protein
MMHDCAVEISNAGLIVISLFLRGGCILYGMWGVRMEKANFRIREIYNVLHMHLQGDQDALIMQWEIGIGHHVV